MEKPSLPIKTKIAAWWMVTIGGIGIILSLFPLGGFISTRESTTIVPIQWLIVTILIFLPSFLFFLAGFILHLKRKRRSWWFSIIILFIIVLSSGVNAFSMVKDNILYHPPPYSDRDVIIFVISFFVFTFPFILLLLERKNFWKIAT